MTSQCRESAGDRNLLTSGVGGLESDPEARFPGKLDVWVTEVN